MYYNAKIGKKLCDFAVSGCFKNIQPTKIMPIFCMCNCVRQVVSTFRI